ncbi:unnamed protein product, partial [Scytosiphon promiscuus]
PATLKHDGSQRRHASIYRSCTCKSSVPTRSASRSSEGAQALPPYRGELDRERGRVNR